MSLRGKDEGPKLCAPVAKSRPGSVNLKAKEGGEDSIIQTTVMNVFGKQRLQFSFYMLDTDNQGRREECAGPLSIEALDCSRLRCTSKKVDIPCTQNRFISQIAVC